ncbi:hypothetical protein ACTNE0_08365 [Bacillota bacterium HCP3S3_E9]
MAAASLEPPALYPYSLFIPVAEAIAGMKAVTFSFAASPFSASASSSQNRLRTTDTVSTVVSFTICFPAKSTPETSEDRFSRCLGLDTVTTVFEAARFFSFFTELNRLFTVTVWDTSSPTLSLVSVTVIRMSSPGINSGKRSAK